MLEPYKSRAPQLAEMVRNYRSAFELSAGDALALAELRQELREARADAVAWLEALQASVRIEAIAKQQGLQLNSAESTARDTDIEALKKTLKFIDEVTLV